LNPRRFPGSSGKAHLSHLIHRQTTITRKIISPSTSPRNPGRISRPFILAASGLIARASLLKGVDLMWSDFSLREKILLALLVLLLLGGALWKAAPAVLFPIRSDSPAEGGGLQPVEPAPAPEPEPEMIVVHLVGAVKEPGVYHLPAGSRVYELIEAAGGALEDADTDSINLARPLYDGEQVAVPRRGEAAATAPAENKVNINKASLEELVTLPQIGEGRAKRIIEHREKYGPFTDIKEIMDVSGIGEGIFNQIKDLITVY